MVDNVHACNYWIVGYHEEVLLVLGYSLNPEAFQLILKQQYLIQQLIREILSPPSGVVTAHVKLK